MPVWLKFWRNIGQSSASLAVLAEASGKANTATMISKMMTDAQLLFCILVLRRALIRLCLLNLGKVVFSRKRLHAQFEPPVSRVVDVFDEWVFSLEFHSNFLSLALI